MLIRQLFYDWGSRDIIFIIINLLAFILYDSYCDSGFASRRNDGSKILFNTTWLRSRMIEDRLNGLALMHIHCDISIDIDRAIDRFQNIRFEELILFCNL